METENKEKNSPIEALKKYPQDSWAGRLLYNLEFSEKTGIIYKIFSVFFLFCIFIININIYNKSLFFFWSVFPVNIAILYVTFLQFKKRINKKITNTIYFWGDLSFIAFLYFFKNVMNVPNDVFIGSHYFFYVYMFVVTFFASILMVANSPYFYYQDNKKIISYENGEVSGKEGIPSYVISIVFYFMSVKLIYDNFDFILEESMSLIVLFTITTLLFLFFFVKKVRSGRFISYPDATFLFIWTIFLCIATMETLNYKPNKFSFIVIAICYLERTLLYFLTFYALRFIEAKAERKDEIYGR